MMHSKLVECKVVQGGKCRRRRGGRGGEMHKDTLDKYENDV